MLDVLQDMARRGLLEARIVEALADDYRTVMGRARSAQAADESRYVARYATIE